MNFASKPMFYLDRLLTVLLKSYVSALLLGHMPRHELYSAVACGPDEIAC